MDVDVFRSTTGHAFDGYLAMEYFGDETTFTDMVPPIVDDLLPHQQHLQLDDFVQHGVSAHQMTAAIPDVQFAAPSVVSAPVAPRPAARSRSGSVSSGNTKRPTTASPHIAKAAAAAAASSSSKRQRTSATPSKQAPTPPTAFPLSPDSSSGSPPPGDQGNEGSPYSDVPISPEGYVPVSALNSIQAALSAATVPFMAMPMGGGNMQPWLATPMFPTTVDAQQWMQKVAITRLPSVASAPPEVTVSKEVKKSAHNVIERRYRNNINEKIAELRASIPSNAAAGSSNDDEKMNKGKILKRATDYIRFLRRANDGLRTENERLRDLVRSLGGSEMLAGIKLEPGTFDPSQLNDDYDGGDDDDDERASNGSSDGAGDASGNLATYGSGAARPQRLGDASRVVLMACICLCLAFNPLASVLSSGMAADATQTGAARRLSSITESSMMEDSWSVTLWTYALRAISALSCLFVLMVCEPVLTAGSAELAGVLSLRHEADAMREKGHLARSRRLLSEALSALGRPVPVTSGDLALSLTWNTIRQLAHKLLPAMYLDRFVANRTAHSKASFMSAAETAVSYLETQLLAHPDEDDSASNGGAVHAALSAVNLCESINLAPERMARVYALAAMQLYAALPARVGSLAARHMLRLARREIAHVPAGEGAAALVAALPWLQSSDGHAFFARGSWVSLIKLSASPHLQHAAAHTLDPLARMAALWREQLLCDALAACVSRESSVSISRHCDALHENAVASGDVDAEAWVATIRAADKLDKGDQDAFEIVEHLAENVVPTCGAGSDPARDLLVLALLADAQMRQGHFETAMRACERVTASLSADEAGCGCTENVCVGALARTAAAQRTFDVRMATFARARKGDDIPARFAQKLLFSAQRDAEVLRGVFRADIPARKANLALCRAVLRAAAGGAAHRTASLYGKTLEYARDADLPHVEAYVRAQIEVFAA